MSEPHLIPSFYKHSYVGQKYSVINKPEIINENILTDYDSTHHIRIMKRFETPNYHCSDENERKWLNDTKLENSRQKTFFLRCYLPKNKISHRERPHRIQHLIVMFNGLNECAKYDLYDVMGAQFAEDGIATILLPTPFHLNRRINTTRSKETRSMEKANWQPYELPTDIAFDDKLLYFYNFKRSIKELEALVERIKTPHPNDHGFFENYFTREPEITLFGFSLGGLRALACFLRNPDRYHSCITFNSGVDLRTIHTDDLHLNSTVWKKTFNQIEETLADDPDFIKKQQVDKDILKLFKWLYLGTHYDDLTEVLEKKSYKFFSIQSGADSLFKDRKDGNDNITNPDHGLNRFIVAGVGHVPTIDLRWDNWLSKVGENIVHFINGCKEVHWAHAELEKEIKELIIGTGFFKDIQAKAKADRSFFDSLDFSIEMFKKLIKQIKGNNKDPEKFVELYYISKAFYPKFSELLEKINRSG